MTAEPARASTLAAAARIVYEVVAFRVRRLEMANLAGAVSLMLVLRLPWDQVLWRTAFAALLNVLVYLNNDFHDVELDVASPDKDTAKAVFLLAHPRQALLSQWVLGALLVALAASTSTGLLLVLVAGFGICFLYSARLKHTPGLDVVAMTLWGVVMPLSGSPLDSALGLALALQLGWFSAVFESIQVIRDHDADARQGVRTTAVALGVKRTLWLCRGLMLVVALYAALVLHPLAGGLALAALLLRMREGQAERFWTRVKLVYGVSWLVACGATYAAGHSQGLWLQLGAHSALSMLSAVR
jgi:4-hydroxybenzoate polyprenyltransferase